MIIGLMIGLMLGTTEGRSRGVWRVKRGTVEDVMNRDVVQIPPNMKVTDFINKVINNNHHTSFPVVLERRLHGMLLLDELKQTPREEWSRLEAREVMRPVNAAMFINANTPIPQAQSMLASNGLGRAVVLDSNSKQVLVQLPAAGSTPSEGAPTFEIMDLQLNEGGDIAMMRLNLLGHGSQPA